MKVLIVGEPEWTRELSGVLSAHDCTAMTRARIPEKNDEAYSLAIDTYLARSDAKRRSIEKLSTFRIPILTNSICVTATEQATWCASARELAGFAFLPTFLDAAIVEVSSPHGLDLAHEEQIASLFSDAGKKIERVQDSIGMVFPRILAMIVNEAFVAMEQVVADAQSIDTAMKLATNYPLGPVEWGRKIGLANVLLILQALHTELGDDRYRPSTLLKKEAFVNW